MKFITVACLLALTSTAFAKEKEAKRAPANQYGRGDSIYTNVKLEALKNSLGSGKFISIQLTADPDPEKEGYKVMVTASPAKKSALVSGIAEADYYLVVQELCSQTAPLIGDSGTRQFHCFTK